MNKKLLVLFSLLFFHSKAFAGTALSHEGFVLDLFGGPVYQDYALSSVGFNTSLAPTLGALYGGEFKWRPTATNFSLRLYYRHSEQTYTGLTSLTPTQTTVKHEHAYFGWTLAPMQLLGITGFLESLQAGVLFDYHHRDATDTSPNNVVTSYDQAGFSFFAIYGWDVGQEFNLEFTGRLNLPFYHREVGQDSGYLHLMLETEAKIDLFYTLTERLEVGIGGRFGYEAAYYHGPGSRGSVDASETSKSYGGKGTLRFRF